MAVELKKNVKYAGKKQSFGVTDGVLCSNKVCFKAWVSNPLSARLYYAARCQFVNDVSYTKITQYFRR